MSAIPDAATLFGASYSAGANIHSDSWGNGGSSFYYGSDYDQYLYNNMNFSVFFAAGNSGSSGAGSVTVQSQAKNVISVGSSQSSFNSANIKYVSWFSSIGPSFDGRIKPDLVSPGEAIESANSNGGNGQSCQTLSLQGTSMATPSAAGNGVLIRQYFTGTNTALWTSMCRQSYSFCRSFSPSGVLVKAMLLHSGTQMSIFNGQEASNPDVSLNAPPDMYQGYGRINLLNVLPLATYTKFDLYVDDLRDIGENTAVQYIVTVSDATVPVK
jgi:hypothetical protein